LLSRWINHDRAIGRTYDPNQLTLCPLLSAGSAGPLRDMSLRHAAA